MNGVGVWRIAYGDQNAYRHALVAIHNLKSHRLKRIINLLICGYKFRRLAIKALSAMPNAISSTLFQKA
jgi:hypothetical protein